MTIDKYTKFILTLIAVGVIGINFYLFKINIIEEANATPDNMKVVVSTIGGNKIYLITEDVKYGCKVYYGQIENNKWSRTGC